MSYGRPAQSKAQNDANAKILRTLVKHPDNKVCADCKRHDPRWASWNIGCFLCIRCSGIHRSMGTHISKVKSIDLDIWTPEQMESMQKWGNKRCNLYWEAHLKSGHAPPEHKVESFIRSKYDSRRWAKDGPPPSDPSSLDPDSAPAAAAAPQASAVAAPSARSNPIDLLSEASPAPPVASAAGSNLLDDPPAPAQQPTTKSAPAPAPKASGGGGGIFDLDWHEPAGSTSAISPTLTGTGSGGAPRAKNDIMSLFAAKPDSMQTSVRENGIFGAMSSGASASDITKSVSGLSVGSNSGATADPWATATDVNSGSGAAGSIWGTSTAPKSNAAGGGNGLFDTQDVWGTSSTSPQQAKAPPKNDAFADIWGDSK